MGEWQVCKVETEIVRRRWSSYLVKASAVLLTPDGSGQQVIAEIETEQKEGWALDQMIARLGLEGWEPMPLYTARDVGAQGYPEVQWWFKRRVRQ